jgi:uncharacterized protein (TIGR01244 family)
MDPAEVPNYRLVRPGLATAGQPPLDALPKLKSLGFKTVINLRTEKEGAREEQAAVEAAGLRYVWVPVSVESISLEDVRAVGGVLDDPEAGPVLLHCNSANRVGAVWAVLQARKGKSLEEAEAEGRAIGLRSPALVEAVRRLAGTDDKP